MSIKRLKYPKDRETDDLQDIIELQTLTFEDYCGSCDNFGTDDCPFKDKVYELTVYADLGCTAFWD